jgi:hypothetical protein
MIFRNEVNICNKKEMAFKYQYDIDSYIEGKQPVIMEIYKKCGLC